MIRRTPARKHWLELLGRRLGNLWWVRSAQAGMPLPRNMAVYRLPSGDLVLRSVVCLDAARMAALEALGTPKYMIVPNEGHRTDAPRYKQRYPAIKVLAPAGSRAKIEEVIPVEALCEDVLPGLGIVCHDPDGAKPPGHERSTRSRSRAAGR
jgi:hypothetical protein